MEQQKKREIIILLLIFILAVFLRFYHLGKNPPGLDWDEASLGYNAYTLLKTGNDEYGDSWPLSIRSFNDYKPPFYTYFTIIPVAIFGLNEFSTRFASAFFGCLTVLATYFLVKEIFSQEKEKPLVKFLPPLTSFLLAVSPWHLQFSRIAFEANVGLFWFVVGAWLLIKSVKKGIFLPISAVCFGISLFSYHSNRVVVPLFVLIFLFVYWRKIFIKKNIIPILVSVLITIVFSFLLFYSFKLGGVQARFEKVGIFNPVYNPNLIKHSIERLERFPNSFFNKVFNNRRVFYAKTFLNNYLDHWDLLFLFIKGDPQERHHAVGIAHLYWWELPFVFLGIYWLIKDKVKDAFVVFLWFLLAPIASAMTTGTPGAVRALLYLPTYQIFVAYGILKMAKLLAPRSLAVRRQRLCAPSLKLWSVSDRRRGEVGLNCYIVILSILIVGNFLYYLHMYHAHTPIETSKNWLYGYKEAVWEVEKVKDKYDKVIVTYEYDQPYIYFLFYAKPLKVIVNNGEYWKGFGKYEFRTIDWQKDRNLPNTLFVGTPHEIPQEARILKEIKFLDGGIAFRIAES